MGATGGAEQSNPPAEPAKPAATPPETPAKPAPATAAPSESKGGQAVSPPPPPAPAAPTESKRATTIKDDDEDIPSDATLLEMSSSGFKARLKRHTAKELKDRFGTADPEEIKTKLDRLTELEAKEEENRRKQLTDQERLNEDLAKERQRADYAEQKYRQYVQGRVVERQESRIVKLAEKYLDPDYIEAELPRLAKHLRDHYSEKELAKLTDDKLVEYFQKRIADKPKLARDFQPPAAAPPPAKKPFTNGVKPGDKPTPVNGAAENKTFKPGQPNSMTAAEARAEASKDGYRWR